MRIAKLAVALLLSALPLMAQSQQVQFFGRFVYDDGTAVSGQLAIWDSPQRTNSLFTAQTDANGRVQGTVAVDPTQSGYNGQFSFTNPQGQIAIIGFTQLPFCTGSCAGTVLATIPTGEEVVTIKKADGTYSVSPLGPLPPVIASVTASAASSTVVEGGTDQIGASITCGIWGCPTSVVWASTAGTISPGGLFTAPSTPGPVNITATSTADPTQSATITVTVTNPTPVPLPQTKFSTCVSTPPYGAAPNSPTLFVTQDAGGGQAVGYLVAGEKFDCPVTVPAPGQYTIAVRSEEPYSGLPIHVEYPAGTTIASGVVNATIPAWGSNENWSTFQLGTVTLPAGTVTLRFVLDSTTKWMLNLNWFN